VQQYPKRVWIAVGAASLVLLGAWLTSQLLYGLLVIFAGVLLGTVLTKLSNLLSSLSGLSYRVTFGIVVAVLVTAIVTIVGLLGASVASQAGEFLRQLRESGAQLDQKLAEQPWWTEVKGLRTDATDLLASRQAVSTATLAVSNTFATLGGTVLVLFLGMYFAAAPDRYRSGLLTLVPTEKRRRAGEVVDQIATALWHWVLGRLVGMLLIGIGTAIGLRLLGVPLPISLGVLAGILTFVPNVGPLVALVPAVLFSLQIGTDTALYVILFYFALQTMESYLITPMIDQFQVDVPPGLTLSAQLLFGMVGGLLGLLVATPLIVVISILVREFYVRDILRAAPAQSS
jgi:predicted PurR-regulated permease PerM